MDNKPRNIKEYCEWAKTQLGHDLHDKTLEQVYKTNLATIGNVINEHPFFIALQDAIENTAITYYKSHKCELHKPRPSIEFIDKPFDSCIDKEFRLNVLWNRKFPNAPADGWIEPNKWYERFEDVKRTTITTRFIDGPQTLAACLVAHSEKHGLQHRHKKHALATGYHAQHFLCTLPCQLSDPMHKTVDGNAMIEIQLRTQLQDVLQDLTHSIYADTRLQSKQQHDWQWDIESDRFKAGYLGHTLHLLEAMILELRNRDTTDHERTL